MPKLFAGLDVSGKTTSICVVDASGSIVFETETETTAPAVICALRPYRRRLQTVGQETSGFARHLHRGLLKAKYPIVLLDPFRAHSALKARLNKTDKNDARGLAQLIAGGQYALAHEKSDEAIRMKAVLLAREILLRKAIDLRVSIKSMQRSVVEITRPKRRDLPSSSDGEAALVEAVSRLQSSLEMLNAECKEMDRVVLDLAENHPICRRLMTIPGVGRLCALYFVSAVDDPTRFESSRIVPTYFGLTPRTHQSGETSRSGCISRRGDAAVRRALFMASSTMLSSSHSTCHLRLWGLRIAKAKGHKLASVAVARKLAVLMHHLWITGEDFDPSR